ncbi:GNAT family N-acetyltransferase [Nocardioides yefusunii]|uniref:GNAT family N-acetyltransferase n=1 Tax=Nocardioides yefusunii TaxID=2500546 RepID=A0ABW1QY84_9ACTN|nr:GNAT family N-acetyltransferase [Nocardioides yefusunii]
MELDFRVLDPRDATLDPDVVRGWVRGATRGFHLPLVDDDRADLYARRYAADSALMRGAWLPAGSFGAGPEPVATLASWPGEVNTGSGLVDVRMITDVTVSPAQRRQGLASRMIGDELADAARAGFPLAALTVTEGGIYRRFGFGPATFRARVEVDVSARFSVEHPDDVGLAQEGRVGRCVIMPPVEMWPVVDDVFRRWHTVTRGSVSRHAGYQDIATGAIDWETQKPVDTLRGAVHLDADDRPDGFVLWTHSGWENPVGVLTVTDMVALSSSASLGLWEFLAGIDLTQKVTSYVSPDDRLRWAVSDPRTVKQTALDDLLWLRVLDVPATLTSRPWYGDGEVLVGVRDRLGFTDGTWRVVVRDSDVEVTRTDAAAQVQADVSTLGSLVLGGVSVETLAVTGRLRGDATAVRRLASMADGGDVPYCATDF